MLCRFNSAMVTDAAEGKISGWRRASYRFHLSICPYCQEFRAQMNRTAEAARELGASEEPRALDAQLLAVFRARGSVKVSDGEDDGGDEP
jgi:hypothetical protein